MIEPLLISFTIADRAASTPPETKEENPKSYLISHSKLNINEKNNHSKKELSRDRCNKYH
jgi:hypothetical protein